jgi:hypothetical protein
MLKIMTSLGAFIYWWTAQPFRELDLSISFNRLKNKICQEEKITEPGELFDMQYERKLGCDFYIYYWLVKRMSIIPLDCCIKKNEFPNTKDPSFEEMLLHFDELKNQVGYQMSLKHLAKTTILGQTTDFKANVLAANGISMLEGIKVVVD